MANLNGENAPVERSPDDPSLSYAGHGPPKGIHWPCLWCDCYSENERCKEQEQTIKRNCLVCLKPLQGALRGDTKQEFREPPGHALIFTSIGNYGSTVFDNPGEQLEISICDDCIVERSKYILHIAEEITYFNQHEVPYSYVNRRKD
jgi:hypothetical protein